MARCSTKGRLRCRQAAADSDRRRSQTTFDNSAVSDGDNITIANSSGGGDALNDVVKTGSGVDDQVRDDEPGQGATSASRSSCPARRPRRSAATSSTCLTTASAYPDVMFRPYQAAWSVLLSGHREDGTKRWSVVIRKDGRLELRDRKNAVVATSTGDDRGRGVEPDRGQGGPRRVPVPRTSSSSDCYDVRPQHGR